jgi:hypothetical protein
MLRVEPRELTLAKQSCGDLGGNAVWSRHGGWDVVWDRDGLAALRDLAPGSRMSADCHSRLDSCRGAHMLGDSGHVRALRPVGEKVGLPDSAIERGGSRRLLVVHRGLAVWPARGMRTCGLWIRAEFFLDFGVAARSTPVRKSCPAHIAP